MPATQSFTKCSIAILFSLATAVSAYALELKGFKDELFSYPSILSSEDNGALITVDYQEMRDINGRDEIPERRAKRAYVSLGVKRYQVMETIESAGRQIDVFRAGETKDASFAVIFIHGRGGDRKLGANDYSFGGNFNRLKNIAVENNGVYYAPSIKSFDSEGVADTSALIAYIHATSPSAKIVLACASMGSFVCWVTAKEKAPVADLSGMMIMGGATDPDYLSSPAFKKKLPLFFSHGSRDSVYSYEDQLGLYRKLLGKTYPTHFVLFESGSHGTPVRMTDWRDSLSWVLK